jgi:hypothetical protein
MLNIDPREYLAMHHQDLITEAEQVRLASMLPPRTSAARHELALLCHRLANWLDDPARYVQPADSGREDWVTPYVSV